MGTPFELSSLLGNVAELGIPVGVEEVLRLRTYLEGNPTATLQELRTVVLCTLAKTDDERNLVASHFDRWEAHAEFESGVSVEQAGVGPGGDREFPEPRPGARRGLSSRKRRRALVRRVIVGVGLAALATLLWLVLRSDPGSTHPLSGGGVGGSGASTVPSGVNPEQPTPPVGPLSEVVPHYVQHVPKVQAIPRVPTPTAYFVLAALALSGAGAAYVVHRRRLGGVVEVAPSAIAAPPLREPDLRVPGASFDYLRPSQVRDLVWNIEHFVSEETTARVDVPKTVDGTARSGGIASIVMQPAVYPREVWLWRDSFAEAPGIPEVQQEIAADLARYGLPVRTGSFHALPAEVFWEDNQTTESTLALEGQREQATLAVLTDGRGLARAERYFGRRSPVSEILQSLSTYPRITFADFSYGAEGLEELLRPHGIDVVTPEALARRLGGLGGGERAPKFGDPRPFAGEIRAWAAALALSGQSFDAETAHALRQALGLRLTPWDLRFMITAPGITDLGGIWEIDEPLRSTLVDELARASDWSASVDPTSWLAKALAFWRARLDVADRGSSQPEERVAAFGDPVARAMARATLDLFDRPGDAAERFERLAHAGEGARVRERLAVFEPAEATRPGGEGQPDDFVRVPWSWRTPPPWIPDAGECQATLYRLGFGSRSLSITARPKRSAVFGVVAAILLAAGAGLIAAGCWQGLRAPRVVGTVPAEVVAEGGRVEWAPESGAGAHSERKGLRRLDAGTFGGGERVAVDGSRDVRVTWSRMSRPSLRADAEGYTVIYRGRRSFRSYEGRPSWLRRSVALVQGDPNGEGGEAALRLLDGGFVDVAAVGTGILGSELSTSHALLVGCDQALLVSDGDAGAFSEGFFGPESGASPVAIATILRKALIDAKTGVRGRLAEVLPAEAVRVIRGDPQVALKVERALRIRMVALPGGTFVMGSPESEAGRLSWEGPQHRVTVSPFAIGATEVSRGDYLGVMGRAASEWASGDPQEWPATDLSWWDAIRFCNALSRREGLIERYEIGAAPGEEKDDTSVRLVAGANGYRLPTEAEWEYACRAGTTTPFSFGTTVTTDQVNYDGNVPYGDAPKGVDRGRPVPVGSLPANAFGLHEMHGNAWEWCHDLAPNEGLQPYAAADVVDPRGESIGSARVVRGGGFRVSAWGCRSAYRYWGGPGVRSVSLGFRVVLPSSPER